MAKIDTRIIIFYTICIIIGSWSIIVYRGMNRSVDRGVDRGVVYYRGMVDRFVVDNRGVVYSFGVVNRSMVNRSMVDRGVVDRGMVNWGVVANGANGTTGMDRGMVNWGVVADGTKPVGKGNNSVAMAWAMISQGQANQCDENINLEFVNFLLSKLLFSDNMCFALCNTLITL